MKRAPEGAAVTARDAWRRILLVKIAFVCFFVIVAARLVQIQVFEAGRYQDAAQRQYEVDVELQASRGRVMDRSGKMLVSNTAALSLAADPRMLGPNIRVAARRVATAFDKPVETYLRKLMPKSSNFVWLERQVDPEMITRIRPEDFEGMITLKEHRRVYHFGDMAGQVLGFTDRDGKGISGIELQFDRYLAGTNGMETRQRDGLGRSRPAVDFPRIDPVNGHNVVLTLDAEIQAIAEEALRAGIEEAGAVSGLVVMLDPMTGEILAMANYPRLDPSLAGKNDPALLRNRVVTDKFEPGSVFKIVTVGSAIEHKIIAPGDKFFAENGRYTVSLPRGRSRVITDIHPYGTLSFREGLELSSNIVMAKASDMIGAENLYRSARDFGFGTETGVELPGEVGGELKKPADWSGTTLNSLAYGYEVGVTPLQIAAAYGAVASGGVLYKPSILRAAFGDDGEIAVETSPQVIRRVISEETAATLRDFLVGVVENGTGKEARVPGSLIAGKTGTARKVVDGKYVTGSYTATFAGFFPADRPKAVCVVMLDTKADAYTGGRASAPIFRRIAERVIGLSDRFAGDPIAEIGGHGGLYLPDVRNMRTGAAVRLLEEEGVSVNVQGDGLFVVGQSPSPGAKISAQGIVTLTSVGLNTGDGSSVTVPDLRNLSVRRAVNRLRMESLAVSAQGSGVVVGQFPAAGTKVKPGTTVRVQCELKYPSAVSLQ